MVGASKPSAYETRIALVDFRPEISRRVLVPGSARLHKLHLIFQIVMGWTDSNLHAYRMDRADYGMQVDDFLDDEPDERKFTLSSVVGPGDRFVYEYDLGDSWDHEVTGERASRVEPTLKSAVCLDGANACPLEDVGGTGGYQTLLEVLADANREEHGQYMSSVGPNFDPTRFDLAPVNAALQHLG